MDTDPLYKPATAFDELKEVQYKAELDLVEKYQVFVAELLRLALLGIAVFGFLQGKTAWCGPALWFAVVGLGAFGLSAAGAVAFRFFATEGARFYLEALRHSTQARTAPDNCEGLIKSALESLHKRKSKLRVCRSSKAVAAVMLGLGGLLMAAAFSWQVIKESQSRDKPISPAAPLCTCPCP